MTNDYREWTRSLFNGNHFSSYSPGLGSLDVQDLGNRGLDKLGHTVYVSKL